LCPTPASPATHTLSLHDALPICAPPPSLSPSRRGRAASRRDVPHARAHAARGLARERRRLTLGRASELAHAGRARARRSPRRRRDRKSTRLNSSHVAISYAVFCL